MKRVISLIVSIMMIATLTSVSVLAQAPTKSSDDGITILYQASESEVLSRMLKAAMPCRVCGERVMKRVTKEVYERASCGNDVYYDGYQCQNCYCQEIERIYSSCTCRFSAAYINKILAGVKNHSCS